MSITPINLAQTSNPTGTPQQIYSLYNSATIDPGSSTDIDRTTVGQVDGVNQYNAPAGNDVGVAATLYYQNHLQNDVAKRESINQDINAQLNYTMMAMGFWVPLGVFAAYYLYNKGD